MISKNGTNTNIFWRKIYKIYIVQFFAEYNKRCLSAISYSSLKRSTSKNNWSKKVEDHKNYGPRKRTDHKITSIKTLKIQKHKVGVQYKEQILSRSLLIACDVWSLILQSSAGLQASVDGLGEQQQLPWPFHQVMPCLPAYVESLCFPFRVTYQ